MDPIILDLIKVGGPAMGVFVITYIIIKAFLDAQSKQEDGYQQMVKNQTDIYQDMMNKKDERHSIMLSTHLNHNTQAMEKLNETLGKNTVMIEKVLTCLELIKSK